MKPIFSHAAGAIALTFAIAACTSAPPPGPAPAPAPSPTTTAPAPLPIPAPAAPNWIDNPQTPGNWRYRAVNGGSIAEFGDANSEPRLAIGCSAPGNQVSLIRYLPRPAAGGSMTVRTETATRTVTARSSQDGNAVSALFAANDPLLDAIALTRGRFAVEIAGAPALYLPNWAEVTRVIEDCR